MYQYQKIAAVLVVALSLGGCTQDIDIDLASAPSRPEQTGGQPTTPTTPLNIKTIELTPAGGRAAVGQTLQTRAICRLDGNETTTCRPVWDSSEYNVIGVNPDTGLLQFLKSGSSSICVQWSRTEREPRACHTFTTTN